MLNILGITDNWVPCQHLCFGMAVSNLPTYLKANVVMKDIQQKDKLFELENKNEVDFVLFEPGMVGYPGITTKLLRSHFPKAKLLAFATDTNYVKAHNCGFQLDSPQDCDLYCEHMELTLDWMKEKGVSTDYWQITGSELLFHHLLRQPKADKVYDFIGVYHPIAFNDPNNYRTRMRSFLQEKGYTFTQGEGEGHYDNANTENLFSNYAKSWFTLGTSSHNDPLQHRGSKGFRDWVGPFCHSLLIYDDYPDVIKHRWPCPIYKFGDFEHITRIADWWKANPGYIEVKLKEQQAWAMANSIEKQIVQLMLKHKFVDQKDLYENAYIYFNR